MSEPCPLCPDGEANVWREWRLLDGKSFGAIIVCTDCDCTVGKSDTTQARATAAAWAAWRAIPRRHDRTDTGAVDDVRVAGAPPAETG